MDGLQHRDSDHSRTEPLTLGSAARLSLALTAGLVSAVASQASGGPLSSRLVHLMLVAAVVLIGAELHARIEGRRLEAYLDALDRERERSLHQLKDRFIARVSHELRTPLTGIVGFSHLLRSRPLSPDASEAVNLIMGEAAELSRMVDDLLIAARVDADTLTVNSQPVWFSDQTRSVTEFMALMEAPVEVDCQDARIQVDSELFRQVLRNLVVNAHQHGRPQVVIRGRVRGDRYVCSVTDQGPGVPPELRETLFTRWGSGGDTAASGRAGLGLAVASHICKLMDCELSYRRIHGETQFVVVAPLAVGAQGDPEGQATADAPLPAALPA
jgi:two-component system OmpR family sensor kinase